ncbi:MAG: DUF2271 domain-containing protein [Gammaproteobacteria bacterium]|nr:DUF2271 domain-containing protein [Gammaproteobacteria bacterium]
MLRFSAILTLAFGILLSGPAVAKQIEVVFELPGFDTADYHKPYVAIWKESNDDNKTLLLWHMHHPDKKDKWLSDIRRWWRKVGRYLEGEPQDALTGATRGPGTYRETFEVDDDSPFTLYIEVAREDGGRSLVKQEIDFSQGKQTFTLPADKEIGELTITLE